MLCLIRKKIPIKVLVSPGNDIQMPKGFQTQPLKNTQELSRGETNCNRMQQNSSKKFLDFSRRYDLFLYSLQSVH